MTIKDWLKKTITTRNYVDGTEIQENRPRLYCNDGYSISVQASELHLNSKYGRINFYISPKRLYEETGYMWKGEKK